ncbi:MAG: cytidylate kinase-like family protein [Clostridiales bacterium]|nr:cytidylate kinase-like family protein [Clostridiales bacterium]
MGNDRVLSSDTNCVITVGRQFGSGGRKIAKKVADLLGIEFYDKSLIALAAKESGLSENLFDGIDEKPTNSLLYSLVMGLQSDRGNFYRYGDILNSDSIFRIQSQVIQDLVKDKSCVIVGRCSDYVLRENKNVVNVFIHADQEFKLERVMRIYKQTEKEALDTMRKTDKKRSNYYNFYTNQEWGNVTNYHIALNSAFLGIDDTAKIICDYIKMKFSE